MSEVETVDGEPEVAEDEQLPEEKMGSKVRFSVDQRRKEEAAKIRAIADRDNARRPGYDATMVVRRVDPELVREPGTTVGLARDGGKGQRPPKQVAPDPTPVRAMRIPAPWEPKEPPVRPVKETAMPDPDPQDSGIQESKMNVLDALRELGPSTSATVAARLGRKTGTVGVRLGQLAKKGEVHRTAQRVRGGAGNQLIVWALGPGHEPITGPAVDAVQADDDSTMPDRNDGMADDEDDELIAEGEPDRIDREDAIAAGDGWAPSGVGRSAWPPPEGVACHAPETRCPTPSMCGDGEACSWPKDHPDAQLPDAGGKLLQLAPRDHESDLRLDGAKPGVTITDATAFAPGHEPVPKFTPTAGPHLHVGTSQTGVKHAKVPMFPAPREDVTAVEHARLRMALDAIEVVTNSGAVDSYGQAELCRKIAAKARNPDA